MVLSDGVEDDKKNEAQAQSIRMVADICSRRRSQVKKRHIVKRTRNK